MVTIKIMNEFLHSPIWTYGEDGIVTEDPSIIENDSELQELCDKAAELFSGYYEFDSHDQPCWFNHEQEKKDKDIMLELIRKILARLDELNDGSFVVEDYETERLNSL